MEFSYRPKALREIWDLQNRKGKLPTDLLPDVTALQDAQRDVRRNLKKSGISEAETAALQATLVSLIAETEEKLQDRLVTVSEVLLDQSSTLTFNWDLKIKSVKNNRTLYTIRSDAATYFADKLLQRSISESIRTRSVSRNEIVASIRAILSSDLPMALVKIDVQDYYGSISHSKLLDALGRTEIRPSAIALVEKLLGEYKALTNKDHGLPVGVGVSAKLAELYLNDIDLIFSRTVDVTYYSRFVDDIFMVVSLVDASDNRGARARDELESKLSSLGLALNPSKHYYCISLKSSKFSPFDHLGYRFDPIKGDVAVGISAATNKKIRGRVDRTLDVWDKSNHAEHGSRQLLLSRLRYLTGNTRLLNNKRNALVGVRYSNPEVSSVDCWEKLDKYLEKRILQSSFPPEVLAHVSKFSFVSGFRNRTMHYFTARQFKDMRRAWDA